MSTDRIEKKILLRAPMARVWRAISDSQEFGSWFGMKFDGPFVAGKSMTGVIAATTMDAAVAQSQKPYEGLKFAFEVDRIVPEKLFSFRWHPYAVDPNVDYSKEPPTLVVFELEQTKDGVLLTITESGFDKISVERRADAFKANEGGWTMQLKLIEKYVTRA